MNDTAVLRMSNITKRFPGVLALDNVSFDVKAGEVHALVGENGAGKSTLMKILGGVYSPDAGTIEINGQPVKIATPRDALGNRIGVIYQEFNLVQTLDVAENIFLGSEITNRWGRMNRKEMHSKSREVMSRLGITDFETNTKISALSVAMQQLVEISKALFHQSIILVMDEPTAVLTDRETEKLFAMMMDLKGKGMGIVYISHRLEEVVSMGDRITILRDGVFIDTIDNSNHNVDQNVLIHKMVGRELNNYYPRKAALPTNDARLEVRNISKENLFHNISFEVKKGETLGIAGLVGAGRTEIVKAIFGAIPIDSGDVLVDGKVVNIKSPSDARKAGLALVPEDRKKEGVNLAMSMADNIAMASHESLSVAGHMISSRKRALVGKYIADMQIRPPDSWRRVRELSGGNQQKVVVAKWMATTPKVIIFDEPTRGIDIGAKTEIYELINAMTERGIAVVVVSSELQELIGISDRMIVVNEGKITGEFRKNEFDPNLIMKAATY